MLFWLIIFLTLSIQEGISTNIVLFKVYNGHLSIYWVSVIFLLILLTEAPIGYKLGKLLQRMPKKWKIFTWPEIYIKKFDTLIGGSGEFLFVILMSLTCPPILSGLLSSYLSETTFKKIYLIIIIGDVIWYVFAWAIVLGVSHWITDSKDSISYLVIITLLIMIVQKIISRRFQRGRTKRQ